MISIFLFTACQLGLTQGNPDFIYSQEEPHQQDEQVPSEETPIPPSKYGHSVKISTTKLEENRKIPNDFIMEETPNLYEDIMYEDGIFDPTATFDPYQPRQKESETSPEEYDVGESCFIEIELLCGPDGWIDRQLHLQTDTEDQYFWNTSCEREEQVWDYYLSEFFTFTISQGEELTLSLCDDEENCEHLTSKDLGIRILSNDSELEYVQIASTWSFAYTCQ